MPCSRKKWLWCSAPWATTTKADLGITGTEKMKVTTGDDITKELLSGTLQISMSIVQALEDGIAQSVRAATILRNMLREDFTTLAKSAKSEHHRYNVNAATTIARKPNEHHPGCTLRRTGRGSPYDDYTIRDTRYDSLWGKPLCGVPGSLSFKNAPTELANGEQATAEATSHRLHLHRESQFHRLFLLHLPTISCCCCTDDRWL